MTEIKLISIDELLAIPYSARAEAVELLREAANLAELKCDGSASWRAVDALVILKRISKDDRLEGIDSVTGRGGRVTIK